MLILLLLPSLAIGKEIFKFADGARIQVFSDKAFRYAKKNIFEAVGNIIITYDNATIYGDQATINFSSGDIQVQGNTRYIEPQMTIYGPKIYYNFKTKNFSLQKSRLTTRNYTISGDKIDKIDAKTLIAENAEYTTCQDCPESWSIFGRKIHITADQYARIWHAYIKIKGAVAIYVPYIILPVKTKRETGLLFPKISLNFNQGFEYQQPWFWNISDHTDMTLTPSLWGNRGWGNQFQFRQMLGEKKWYEINSFQIEDHIYLPHKQNLDPSGDKIFRHISDYEHHYTDGLKFNHHFNYTVAKDLDALRDFNFYTDSRIEGSETGGGGFFEYKNNFGQITLEGYYNRNTIFPEARGFDERYIQILPRIHLSLVPLRVLKTSLLFPQKIFLGVQGDVTRFKQNKVSEESLIRNAIRYNAKPYLNWKISPNPVLKIESKILFDYQHYQFPHLPGEESFTKSGIAYETQAQMTFVKAFGSDRKKEIIRPPNPSPEQPLFNNVIGNLPPLDPNKQQQKHVVTHSTFKHSQNIRLKHYFLSDQKWEGNTRWQKQIEQDRGQFDLNDAIKRKKHTINTLTAKTSLPLSNTIEIQWNNSLIRKSPHAQSNDANQKHYSYNKITWLNVSQGYDLYSQENKFRKNLTRLHITGGAGFHHGSLSFSDYYFYDSQQHITSLKGNVHFSWFSLGVSFNYDPFTSPSNKKIELSNSLKLSDFIALDTHYTYDFENQRQLEQGHKVLYIPPNNCWQFELNWNKSIIEKRISFNFFINFNQNSFQSLNQF